MEEFFNSKPVMTPLIAGATTTSLTATAIGQFDVPWRPVWVALAFSFFLASYVWADKSLSGFMRGFMHIVTAITIFTVSVGLNEQGRALAEPEQVETRAARAHDEGFFKSWFTAPVQ